MWWVTGEVIDDHERPRLAKVASYELDEDGRPPAHEKVRERFGRGLKRRYRDKVSGPGQTALSTRSRPWAQAHVSEHGR